MRKKVLVSLALMVAPCVARACSLPVYRFANDNWAPDRFIVEIPDEFDPDTDRARAVDYLNGLAGLGGGLNVDIRFVRGAGAIGDARLRVRYPASRAAGLIGEYPFTLDGARAICESPARRALADALAGGATMVWLVVGDDDGVSRATPVLERELARLEEHLELPELSPEDSAERPGPPLRIEFPVVAVDRSLGEERFLVDMLSRESDILNSSAGPIFVPVFGRGRMLTPINAASSAPGRIERACEVATAPCSCLVKAKIPGTDMLLLLEKTSALSPPRIVEYELASLDTLYAAGSETAIPNASRVARAALSSPPAADEADLGPVLAWVAPCLAAIVLVVGIASLALLHRKRCSGRGICDTVDPW